MAVTKDILILANSIRFHNRCIAGKELITDKDLYTVGPWIRLADSSVSQGAIAAATAITPGHGEIRPLDIVRVSLEGPCNDPNHPEDWWIDSTVPWQFIETIGHADLAHVVDNDFALWHDQTGQDSVAVGYVPSKNTSTLALINAPQNMQFQYWKENVPDYDNPGQIKVKKNRKLSFSLGGVSHEFSVTDPAFTARHNIYNQMQQDRPQTFAFPALAQTFLCLSLTTPFRGKHYKIGATIFEP